MKIPEDLKNLFIKTKTIKRFQKADYPKEAFEDTVAKHIKRLVLKAGKINLPQKEKNVLEKIFWLHDLAEIEIGEFTTIQKARDKKLAKKLRFKEHLTIEKMFSKNDGLLLRKHELANDYLKGATKKSPEAIFLLSVVLDKIDGNTMFHKQITNWCQSKKYNQEKMANIQSLSFEYTFLQKEKFIDNLKKLKQDKIILMCAENLDKQIKQVEKFWQKVPYKKWPEAIKKYVPKNS